SFQCNQTLIICKQRCNDKFPIPAQVVIIMTTKEIVAEIGLYLKTLLKSVPTLLERKDDINFFAHSLNYILIFYLRHADDSQFSTMAPKIIQAVKKLTYFCLYKKVFNKETFR